REIFIRRQRGEALRAVAADFGITDSTVSRIALRKSYAEVTADLGPIPKRGPGPTKLSDSQARQIHASWNSGGTCADLAREFGVSLYTVRSIAMRHTYRAATAGLTPETIAPGSGRLPGAEEQRVRKA
ncbi:MAG: hypothetical protein ACPG77_14410, partial [Nannocystaceae bacterium]